jgi:hypothetical protein
MSLSPQLSTHFVDSRVISFDLDLSAATPEKCAHKFATMTVELQRMISRWSLSGKGDEDLDGYDAGEDEEDEFGSLTHCSQGALDSHANFLGTSQPYILYLWEYLNVHDLLKTSFQRLDLNVAAKNGGKGAPSIIQSQPAKHSPSNESSLFVTRMTENEDAISVSINLLGENNLRAAHLKSNATEKIHSAIYCTIYERKRGSSSSID